MNKFIFVVIMLFVLNVVLNACSGTKHEEPISQSCEAGETDGAGLERAGIVNGKTLGKGNQYSSRVVLIRGIDKSGEVYTCTGSLLPNNLVLTAAHCAEAQVSKTTLIFSTSYDCRSSDNSRQVVAKEVAPNSHQRQNDIALLKYSGALPTGYTTFPPAESDEARSTESLIMVGYGRTGYNASPRPILRITSNKVSNLESDSSGLYFIDQRQTGVCSGDSGGPLVVVRNGIPRVIGVASAVANPDESEDRLCSGVSIYVKTSQIQGWLRDATARLTR